MKRALLVIDVQVSSVINADIAKKIEKLQYDYDNIFISLFNNKNSPLLKILQWEGYQDESLAFTPKDGAVIFSKTGYSSFLPEMKNFDEIYLCGFDTDACIYKTAMDLIENNIRPIILKDYCFSANQEFHDIGLKLLGRNIGKHNII
ncbi:MAG: isochorismatase family protein [Alphaproteobacteria bacterium]